MNTQVNKKTPRRNDPCPCGSGKKYKKCCANLDASTQQIQRNLLQQATYLFEHGHNEEAVRTCSELLLEEPGNSGAHNIFGLAQYRLGNLHEARSHLEIAATGEPKNALILNNLCHITELMGEHGLARQYCRKAISINPKLADAYNNLGNVLVNDDKSLGDALKQYRKAVQLAPDNPQFLMNVASVLHKTNDISEAENLYLKIIRLAPNWNEPLKNIGALEFQKGNYVKARLYLEKAHALDVNDSEVLLSLSQILKYLGDFEAAEKCLKRLDQLQTGEAQPQLELASLYQKIGLLDKMEEACQQAAQREPENPGVFEVWAGYEEGRHRLDRAMELLEKAEALGLSKNSLLRAKIARRNKDWERARLELEKLDPSKMENEDQYRYFYDKGYVLDKLGLYDQAWQAFSTGADRQAQFENVVYEVDKEIASIKYLDEFFDEERLGALDRIKISEKGLSGENAAPLFIVGFPRSGTTLLEQILCSHPDISAGDELPYIREVGSLICVDAGDNSNWPDCLDSYNPEALAAELDKMRQHYLGRVEKAKVVDIGARFFTDKMPLNLVSLPLIHLLFPGSPIVHIVRNPVDSCLSNYFSCFGSGNHHSLNIGDAAKYFRATLEYAESISERIKSLNYLRVRYEDLIFDQEKSTREIIKFIGVPWDDACLSHHLTKRVSRTLSYEEVTRKIYTSSVSRYRNYEQYLSEPLDILRPIMERYGYLGNDSTGK